MRRRDVLSIGPASPRRARRRRRLGWLLAGVAVLLVAARLFLVELVVVRGDTMAPTALDGDVLLVLRRTPPRPGDVVLLEPGEGPPVLRRVIGVPGDEIAAVDGLVKRNGDALETRVDGTFAYAPGGDGAARPHRPYRRQQILTETLAPGRTHRVLGDFAGAARPWRLELPPARVPPGFLYVLCDNRRVCGTEPEARAGLVPADRVRGVARFLLWYGDARADPPAHRPIYGAFVSLESGPSSGGSTTGEPRK